MWLVAGLGNPGAKYENTRHNLGFMLLDRLAAKLGVCIRREECKALMGRAEINGSIVEFSKPQTYMNLSGESISCLLRKREGCSLIVVTDDLALPLGKIRLRPKGSAGGHNGLKSIIERTGSDSFCRLRIGIQPDHPLNDTKRFVLEKFSKTDSEKVEEVLERSAEAIFATINDGIEKAMAQFN